MSAFDDYCLSLLEQAKRFLEKAKEEKRSDGVNAYLNASLLISMSSLEAFINNVISEFKEWKELSTHEKSLLLEKAVSFENGQYVLLDRLQMSRLTDRLELLLRKFCCKTNYRNDQWWAELNSSVKIRNSIIHPKEVKNLTIRQVEVALSSIVDCIDYLFRTIYKKKFPNKGKALNSKYSF